MKDSPRFAVPLLFSLALLFTLSIMDVSDLFAQNPARSVQALLKTFVGTKFTSDGDSRGDEYVLKEVNSEYLLFEFTASDGNHWRQIRLLTTLSGIHTIQSSDGKRNFAIVLSFGSEKVRSRS